MASAITAESGDMPDFPHYEFDKLKDGARMRLLEIQPAPNATDTLNCTLIHVPIRTPKTKDTQQQQRESRSKNAKSSARDDAPKRPADLPDITGDRRAAGTASPIPIHVSHKDRAMAENAANKVTNYNIHMPQYEALSYRWGSGEPSCSLRIHKNGKIYRFQVHQHLHDALIALRHKSDFRNLWVDNICVNQRNVTERNEQVARMNEIYGDAFNVCIWLGQAEHGSTEALKFLAEQGLNIYEFDELCSNEHFVRRWASLLKLLKRDWFSRRWVVQEVCLAQNATVHCGTTSANWEDFADAVSLLNDIDLSAKKLSNAARRLEALEFPPNLFGEIGALPATHLVNTANRMFKKSIGGHQRLSTLEQIVARLSMFESGEPRDYIYALLALAKDSQPFAGLPDHLDGRLLTSANKKSLQAVIRLLPTPHRQSYNVDYEQEVVDVYQQFIAFAISKSDPALALDVICRPFAPTYVEGLPSWIPVVSELPFAPQVNLKRGQFKMERQRGDPFVSMPDTFPQYNAAGRKPLNRDRVRWRKRTNHYSMFVEGFILDEVVKVEPASQMGNIPEEWVALGKQQIDEQAFWKTLVADRGPKGGVPGIYGKAIKAALRVADNGLDIAGHTRENSSTIISDALPHVQNTIWGRCLIETKRHHLGLGPKKLEKASRTGKKLLVCIVHGCSVPIILQECAKTSEEVERERIENEEDRLERHRKAEPYLSRWLEKMLERRERKGKRAQGKMSPSMSDGNASPFMSRTVSREPGSKTVDAAKNDAVTADEPFKSNLNNGGPAEGESEAVDGYSGSPADKKAVATDPVASTQNNDATQLSLKTEPSKIPASLDPLNRAPDREKHVSYEEGLMEFPLLSPVRSHQSSRAIPEDESPPLVYYKVIGESYVYNMMHGEAIKWQNDTNNGENGERVRTQIFELR